MLSFSSFGSVRASAQPRRSREAVEIVRRQRPELVIDGEMHLDTAVVPEIAAENYPHSRIHGDANVLIFPDLAAGNIGYKLVQRLGARRKHRPHPDGHAPAGQRAASTA